MRYGNKALFIVGTVIVMACRPSGGGGRSQATATKVELPSEAAATCESDGVALGTQVYADYSKTRRSYNLTEPQAQQIVTDFCKAEATRKLSDMTNTDTDEDLGLEFKPLPEDYAFDPSANSTEKKPEGVLNIVKIQAEPGTTGVKPDSVESGIGSGVSPAFGDGAVGFLMRGIHGLGIGVGIDVTGSNYVQIFDSNPKLTDWSSTLGMTATHELVYHRGSRSSTGEFGAFCSVGGGAAFGPPSASASLNVILIKTLGCFDSLSYEGGFLNFSMMLELPFVGGTVKKVADAMKVGISFGIDGEKFLSKFEKIGATLSNNMTESELSSLKDIYKKLDSSTSVFEVLAVFSLFNFMYTVGTSAAVNQGIHAMGDAAKDQALNLLSSLAFALSRLINLDSLKRAAYWPSFKEVFTNLRNVLIAESVGNAVLSESQKLERLAAKFPFSSAVLSAILDSMTGCDAISYPIPVKGLNAGGKDADPDLLAKAANKLASGFSISLGKINYSYYTSPRYIPDDEAKKILANAEPPPDPGTCGGVMPMPKPDSDPYMLLAGSKSILFLDSFADFIKPEKYKKMAQIFTCNMLNTVNYVVKPLVKATNTVAKTPGNVAGTVGNAAGGVIPTIIPAPSLPSFLVDPAVCSGASTMPLHQKLAGRSNDLCLAGIDTIAQDTSKFTGASEFGPIAFVAKLMDMRNPLYIYNHCIKPAADTVFPAIMRIQSLFGSSDSNLGQKITDTVHKMEKPFQ